MKTNNVIIVAMNNCALISTVNGYTTVMNSTNNTVASLTAIEEFLNEVPTNEELTEVPYQLVLGDKSAIKGFATGTHLEYIRTGANASGKKFAEEELELIKKVAFALAQRSLNVKITTDKFISNNDKETRELISNSWDKLKAEIKGTNSAVQAPASAPVAQAKSPVIAKLEELMTKALEEGDFDQYDKLEERLNKMMAKETSAPVEQKTTRKPSVKKATKENVVVEEPEMSEEELLDSIEM